MSRRRANQDQQPGSAYELLFRLERPYRLQGWVLALSGLVGFGVAIVMGDPWLLLLAGPAVAAGGWLMWKDPREYLALQPRTRRLQLLRVYGRRRKVRAEFNLREFARLETAQYLARPKGLRSMIILFRPDGSAEKVDDRLHEPELVRLCAEVAETAQLEFVDKGRVDLSS